MRVLVTGGAGYIGSHTVLQLIGAGHEPVIVDDFSNSDRAVVGRLARLAGREIAVHEVNLTDHLQTLDLMASGHFGAVIHFAGHKAVGESVAAPGLLRQQPPEHPQPADGDAGRWPATNGLLVLGGGADWGNGSDF